MTKIVVLIVASVALMYASLALAAIWVYKDAKHRGLQAGLWALLTVLCGYFIGLLLYLLVGRKQESVRCAHCGAGNPSPAAFCSSCGEKLEAAQGPAKSKKGLLIACIACILLAFGVLGAFIMLMHTADGFAPRQEYSMYAFNTVGSAENVSQNCSGDVWKLSFAKATNGYEFSQSYNSSHLPKTLDITAKGKGTMDVMIRQDGHILSVGAIGDGKYTFDLTPFSSGRIDVRLINIDAEDFAATITVTR